MSSQTLGKRVVSVFAAAALSLSMVGAVTLTTAAPAYADDSGIEAQADGDATNGHIGVQTANLPVKVEAGTDVTLSQFFSWTANGTAHVDYKITSTGGTQYGSVNKHSSIFTGLAATPDNTTVTVTAYLVPGAAPTGNKNNPCTEVVLSKAEIPVQVTPTTTYGFQGTDNAVKMITPNVTSYSGSIAEGYTNVAEPVANQGGYYYFTFETIAGFRNYDTPEKYAAYNYDQITAVDADELNSYNLNAQNTGAVTISNVDVANQRITVKVDASAIGSEGQLIIHKGLKANNRDRVVGAELTFDFTAAK